MRTGLRTPIVQEHLHDQPHARSAGRQPQQKDSGNHHEIVSHTTIEKRPDDLNASERGGTANIKQNSTNKGFFRGRRVITKDYSYAQD